MSEQRLADLQSTFDVVSVHWRAGAGGPLLEVKTEQCEALLSVYGAHVVAWTPTPPPTSSGQGVPRPGLFCSPRTLWGSGKAIRGGVPVCWPWFGARTNDPMPDGKASPQHGFARTRPWFVEHVGVADNGRVEVVFLLVSDDDTLALWPHAFETRLRVSLGLTLSITLEVKNVDDTPFEMEGALHTYLIVGDVEQVRVLGLEGTRFVDKVDGGVEATSGREPLTLAGETDRIYVATKQAVVVEDPVLGRMLRIEKSGSNATVVWNPWLVKATAMTDLGGDAWRSFVCVEAAAVRPPVQLSPGAVHTLSTRVSITPSRRLSE